MKTSRWTMGAAAYARIAVATVASANLGSMLMDYSNVNNGNVGDKRGELMHNSSVGVADSRYEIRDTMMYGDLLIDQFD